MSKNESGGLAIIVIGVVLVVLLLPCLACVGFGAFRFLQVDMPAPAPQPVVSVGPASGEQIVTEVCAITAAMMGVGPSEVEPSTSLADLGADDLDIVELVIELEEAFDVSIPDEEISEAAGNQTWEDGSDQLTMSKLAEIIQRHQASGGLP